MIFPQDTAPTTLDDEVMLWRKIQADVHAIMEAGGLVVTGFLYRRPDGTSLFHHPDGTSLYIRP